MLVKVVCFPLTEIPSPDPVPPLLPQSAHWALETQALYLSPSKPISGCRRRGGTGSLRALQPPTC